KEKTQPAQWNRLEPASRQNTALGQFDLQHGPQYGQSAHLTSDWKIRLIDHSRTFRPFDQLKDPKALTTFSRILLARLEALNEPMLQEHLGTYLSHYQIQGLLKRRDAILALAKQLVAEKGAGAVLYR